MKQGGLLTTCVNTTMVGSVGGGRIDNIHAHTAEAIRCTNRDIAQIREQGLNLSRS